MTQEQASHLADVARSATPEQREALLRSLDPELREAVELLLEGESIETSTAIRPLSPETKAPRRVGPYHILREIGEGGMGVVYEADQEKPVRRKVALKLIKWGMDTKAVVARFETERQALALMNHPDIASVFDAGATDKGPAVFRHGVRPGHSRHGVLRQAPADHQRAARALHPSLRRNPARTPEGRHPPGHQALERPRGRTRRQAGPEDHRLWRRQGDFPSAHGALPCDRTGPARRHARVHEPRAGRDDQPRHRYEDGRLLPRGAALRAPRRRAAVRPYRAPRRGPGRDPEEAQRGRPAAAQHQGEQSGGGIHDVCFEPTRGSSSARAPAVGRSRLDHDEGAGEGPDETLRDAQRLCAGRQAFSRQRAPFERGRRARSIVPADSPVVTGRASPRGLRSWCFSSPSSW